MKRPPAFAPMLASTGRPPVGEGVVIEPKWDGVRSIVTVHDGTVGIRSRNERDVTDCYPEVLRPPATVAAVDAVFDGEIVALGADGLPDFQLLQRRMNRRRPSAAAVHAVPVTYLVFDLLWHDGEDLTGLPLFERRRRLEAIDLGGAWQLTPRFTEPLTDELIDSLRAAGVEGVIVKDISASYRPGTRTRSWIKVKARQRHLAVIGGLLVEGARSRAGSLAVGMYLDDGLHYVGQIGNALARGQADQLGRFLDTIPADRSPFVDLASPKLRYVEPLVVVDVEYTETTDAGTFRQPVLKKIVLDVDPDSVVADGHFADAIGRRPSVDVGAGQGL